MSRCFQSDDEGSETDEWSETETCPIREFEDFKVNNPNVGCSVSCPHYLRYYSSIGPNDCRSCFGGWRGGGWYPKQELIEFERRLKAKEEQEENETKDRRERLKRIEEAIEHPIPVEVRAIAIAEPAKLNKPIQRSPAAQKLADKRVQMSDEERSAAKEKDKLRKRELRMRRKEYGSTEDERIEGAARTAKCRSNMSTERLNEANEKAKLGMQNKRKKDDLASMGEETCTPRKRRKFRKLGDEAWRTPSRKSYSK